MAVSEEQKAIFSKNAEEAGRYFKYMAEFVGFTQADVEAIKETALVIEKHIPEIVGKFYAHLLRYPPTRQLFLKKDGTIDQEYLQLRMHHLTNFWRRTASGVYDDQYARYIDYVGRAHTSRGADPGIYIPERYVIGQVGFMQNAINEALTKELGEIDDDLEDRAIQAWSKLMMVILEMLSRAYGNDREAEAYNALVPVEPEPVHQLAVEAYELGLGISRERIFKEVVVARVDEIPDGERKIVSVEGLSIGVFHHQGEWYAVRNSCLHRGGPVAAGSLEGDTLICPWHGYRYNVTNGKLLIDPRTKLETYPVTIKDGEVLLSILELVRDPVTPLSDQVPGQVPAAPQLKENEFYANQLAPGQIKLVHLDGQPVAVYNVGGSFYATQDACTHANGPLSKGHLDEVMVVCPWHGSCFDVTNGQVLCGPAKKPLATYQVIVDGEVGRVI